MLRERFASTSLHFSRILSDVDSLPPITISVHLSRSRFVFGCFALSEHFRAYALRYLRRYYSEIIYDIQNKKNGKKKSMEITSKRDRIRKLIEKCPFIREQNKNIHLSKNETIAK